MATFVLSVGGSTVVPGGVPNVEFLKALKMTIATYVRRGDKFVIVTGGGGTCRTYQTALKAIGGKNDDLDWIGIHVTRLNAEFVRRVFGPMAYGEITLAPKDCPKNFPKPVIVSGGWKPGGSTDTKAIQLAQHIGADLVINISNVDYLYDKDPRKHKNATKICEISWKEYRKMVGNKWTPGMNTPFDPIAAKLADRSDIDVILIGPDTKNLSNVLSERPFRGTVIHR